MDFSNIKPISIHDRTHKVTVDSLGTVPTGDSVAAWYDSLPDVLAASDLRRVARAIAKAASDGREIILAMGAHPIKCGLSPLIIDMMESGMLTCVAMNGAGSIHDFEIAYIGETSEDVAETLQDGSFGMVEETGRILNDAMADGVAGGIGAGKAVGKHIETAGHDHSTLSIQAAGIRNDVDVTVHIAIGTDTIHVHPSADGAVLGKASHLDLQTFTGHIARLEGGVFINLGSAVILPEVFLKALSAVRNMGHNVKHFTTVNMDMIRQYRPGENVLKRPSLTGAESASLIGHHEIMLPLLVAAALIEKERIS